MKRYLIEFGVKLCEDNFTSYGVFYLNADDIQEAFEKMILIRDSFLASYDDFDIINIKRV